MYKGILFLFLSTIIWGIPQPLLFNKIKHIYPIEILCHRALWSFILLILLIFFIGKINKFLLIFKEIKLIISLSLTSLLIAINWLCFIIAINLERLQDASLGYYISPLISIVLGYFFLKERLNLSKIVSIFLMITAILILIFNFGQIPYLAISIGLSWGSYGLIRKRINLDPEIGLLFETGVITIISLPYILILLIFENGHFIYSGNIDTFLLLLTGLFTIMPLFFFNIGVKYLPLGVTGVVFFLTPTFHLLTSVIILKENITIIKLISFAIIWLAIVIFIIAKYNEEKRIIENNTQ